MSKQERGHGRFGLGSSTDAAGGRDEANGIDHEHGESNDHLASIYETREDQFRTVVPFVREGLERGERCLYVADDNTRAEVRAELREGGIAVDDAIESGALSIHGKEDTYLRPGEFEQDAMLEFWGETLSQARDEDGYTGIRAAAEMTWALDEGTGLDRLVQYEAMLNSIYPGEDYVVLCQYNRDRFPPDVLSDVVRTHPYVVYNATVCRNFYYSPPEEFLDRTQPSLDVDRVVEGLLDRARTGEMLAERERGLAELTAVTEELMQAPPDEVCDLATGTAQDVLRPTVTATWLADEQGNLSLDAVESADLSDGSALADRCADLASRAFTTGTSHVSNALDTPPEAGGASLESGVFLPLDDHGVFVVASTDPGAFDTAEVDFAKTLATNTVAALDRAERERRLKRQRERLDTLNQLNTVVQEITHAVVESTTREDIESQVCDLLADHDAYRFAWVGEMDPDDRGVVSRAGAGACDYLADAGTDLTERAIRTREVQVARDITGTDDGWRAHAHDHGVRSAISIPIEHDDACYGALSVYTSRAAAFDAPEREIIGGLGHTIGHAIAALERKDALLSDELVEYEFYATDVLDAFDVPVPETGTIEVDRIVPADDGEFIGYGSGTEVGLETLRTLVDDASHFVDLRVLESLDDPRFELHISEPPVISTVASLGGRVESVVIEDGDYRLTVQVPYDTDIQRAKAAIEDMYGETEIVAKRQTTRTDASYERIEATMSEELTDRQRTVLETAYFAGYFERPRETTGEELAESLGISPPTVSQHLRVGERKLLKELFETE